LEKTDTISNSKLVLRGMLVLEVCGEERYAVCTGTRIKDTILSI